MQLFFVSAVWLNSSSITDSTIQVKHRNTLTVKDLYNVGYNCTMTTQLKYKQINFCLNTWFSILLPVPWMSFHSISFFPQVEEYIPKVPIDSTGINELSAEKRKHQNMRLYFPRAETFPSYLVWWKKDQSVQNATDVGSSHLVWKFIKGVL